MDNKNVKEVIYNQHDKGYKFLLSSKRVFIELLRSFVMEKHTKRYTKKRIKKERF